jgi:hypothetical protein
VSEEEEVIRLANGWTNRLIEALNTLTTFTRNTGLVISAVDAVFMLQDELDSSAWEAIRWDKDRRSYYYLGKPKRIYGKV